MERERERECVFQPDQQKNNSQPGESQATELGFAASGHKKNINSPGECPRKMMNHPVSKCMAKQCKTYLLKITFFNG